MEIVERIQPANQTATEDHDVERNLLGQMHQLSIAPRPRGHGRINELDLPAPKCPHRARSLHAEHAAAVVQRVRYLVDELGRVAALEPQALHGQESVYADVETLVIAR